MHSNINGINMDKKYAAILKERESPNIERKENHHEITNEEDFGQ